MLKINCRISDATIDWGVFQIYLSRSFLLLGSLAENTAPLRIHLRSSIALGIFGTLDELYQGQSCDLPCPHVELCMKEVLQKNTK